jgi:hypothetical protein
VCNNSRRLHFLQKPGLWVGFDQYLSEDWQARHLLTDLKGKGVDIALVREWALWSIHPLGKEEAEHKRDRGENRNKVLSSALVASERVIAALTSYANLPGTDPKMGEVKGNALDLIERHLYLAKRYGEILAEQKKHGTFDTKRLGVHWNVAYLFTLKSHISVVTGWEKEQVLGAITYLVRGVHKTLDQRPSPTLRRLLQKAIHNFEKNPKNTRIIGLIQHCAGNSRELYRMFPPIFPTSSASSAH